MWSRIIRPQRKLGALKIIQSSLASLKYSEKTEEGVAKKLSLASFAKLSRLRYSQLRFGLASAGYRGLGVHDIGLCMYIAG